MKNGVKNIQALAYKSARTVYFFKIKLEVENKIKKSKKIAEAHDAKKPSKILCMSFGFQHQSSLVK